MEATNMSINLRKKCGTVTTATGKSVLYIYIYIKACKKFPNISLIEKKI